jgi:hypothetical protein
MFKPMAFGFVLGGVVSVVGAIADGWLVTQSEHQQQLQSAVVDTQASLCVSQALANYQSGTSDVDLAGLSGSAREARLELAREHAVALPDEESVDSSVINACAHGIDDRITERDQDAPQET